ncbi:MAG: hypothetical protein KBD07_04045 [Candidatus Omnitrophica bacterium]|jgi:multicomponent Na+:H+ antiporter subunit F|nr:hypothetical protein [Candidatus Omnitrophota bacterium]
MTPDTAAQNPWLSLALGIALVFLAVSLALTVLRLIKGPGLCDRVVCLDLVTLIVLGFTSVMMIHGEQPLLMTLLTVIALISFLGTVAFAYYVDKRGARR